MRRRSAIPPPPPIFFATPIAPFSPHDAASRDIFRLLHFFRFADTPRVERRSEPRSLFSRRFITPRHFAFKLAFVFAPFFSAGGAPLADYCPLRLLSPSFRARRFSFIFSLSLFRRAEPPAIAIFAAEAADAFRASPAAATPAIITITLPAMKYFITRLPPIAATSRHAIFAPAILTLADELAMPLSIAYATLPFISAQLSRRAPRLSISLYFAFFCALSSPQPSLFFHRYLFSPISPFLPQYFISIRCRQILLVSHASAALSAIFAITP